MSHLIYCVYEIKLLDLKNEESIAIEGKINILKV